MVFERTMVGQVPMQGAFTSYPVIGDLFAWLSVAGLIVPVGVALLRRRKVTD